ncbi:MAG: hypothetical protein JNL57_13255 [Bacteroidetes bacterium]|nr:hypothetical protein [Bacteroidota bacterium]
MENNPVNNSGEKNKNSKALLYTIIGILLALNVGLFYKWQKSDNEKDKQGTELKTVSTDLKEKNEALAEAEHLLEKYRVDSIALSKHDKEVSEELMAKKNEILALVTKLKKTTTADAAEIAKLKEQLADLTSQLAKLQQENKELVAVNAKLEEDRSRLESENQEERSKNRELSAEKTKYKSLAQRLQASAIKVETLKKRWISGKEAGTKKAKDVESFRTSFTIAENNVAEPGNRTIYVKITGPEGVTMTNPGNESGTFEYENAESKYTYKITTAFDQEAKQVAATTWKPANTLKSGKYTVELYSEGFKMGGTTITLE